MFPLNFIAQIGKIRLNSSCDGEVLFILGACVREAAILKQLWKFWSVGRSLGSSLKAPDFSAPVDVVTGPEECSTAVSNASSEFYHSLKFHTQPWHFCVQTSNLQGNYFDKTLKMRAHFPPGFQSLLSIM